ncbi:TPA: hypothetical protein ACS61N_004589 [Klebsiella oxytoca]
MEKQISTLDESLSFVNGLSDSTIDNIITSHEKLLSDLFGCNRLFFKTVFKSFRFNLATFILSDYYNLKEATLFSVKEKFIPFKMMSRNSISSFFGLLIVTERIKVKRQKSDARRLQYTVTKKLKEETYNLLNSLIIPLEEEKIVRFPLEKSCIDDYLKGFFNNFVSVLNSGLFNFDDIENSHIFITRDSGHMIILKLFCNRKEVHDGLYYTSPIKSLSDECAVSRSHLKSILNQSQSVGFVVDSGKENEFMVTEKFCIFVRAYMRKYIAYCLVGIGNKDIFSNQHIS